MVQLKTIHTFDNISLMMFLTAKSENQFEYLQTHIILNKNTS